MMRVNVAGRGGEERKVCVSLKKKFLCLKICEYNESELLMFDKK